MVARFSRWFGRSLKALLSPVARLVDPSASRRREPSSPQRQLALLQADYDALQHSLDTMERNFQRERQTLLSKQQQLQHSQVVLQAQVDDLSGLVDELMEMVTTEPAASLPAALAGSVPLSPPPEGDPAPPDSAPADMAELAEGAAITEPVEITEPIEIPDAAPVADLSAVKLALVGGHDATRRGVIQDLTRRYGLKKCVELPPSDKASLGRNNMKAKLQDCDLIVLITGYMSHKQTDSVTKLQQAGALSGDVLALTCRGKSGVLREILAYFGQGNA